MIYRFLLYLNLFYFPIIGNCQFFEKTINTIKPYPEITKIVLTSSFYKENKYTGVDTIYIYESNEDKIIEKIKLLVSFENGNRIKLTGFYDNEQMYCLIDLNGKKYNGVYELWYKNSQIKQFQFYENDQLITPVMLWHENGQFKLISDVDIKNKKGIEKEWFNNGVLLSETYCTDSGYYYKKYYDNQQITISYIADKGKQELNWNYKNGKIAINGIINNELFNQVGKWQEWYETGILKRDYYFHDSIPNQKEGTWKWFDEKGNLTKEEYYKNGEKTGEKEYVPGKKGNEKMK